MHVIHLVVKNFRAVADIECEFNKRINVICGPNGVGKTTILQALRIAKGVLAPRTDQESQQVLISLGAASPHFPQRVFFNTLARDPSKDIEIRAAFMLSEAEVSALIENRVSFIQSIVAARIGQNFANPAQLIQLLQSPMGQQLQQEVDRDLKALETTLAAERRLTLGMVLNPSTGAITASQPLAGPIVSFLDRRLPPTLSIFSYFPADRALPMGEVQLQLGASDAQQQLESHNSQPQNKYVRLKTLIVNSLVLGDEPGKSIKDEFERIFGGLLTGRSIQTINVNEYGLLSIMTRETATGRLIELDSLSSGEKNVALTCLLVARSVAIHGIALFDEPELHLNPAVCREIIPFIMEEYAKGREIQFIMCTHSPEVLAGAFRDEDCTLLHLKSPTDLTKIGKSALEEYSEALIRLGTSVSETLFYDGTIFVEGENDISFLSAGFPDIIRKYQLKERGGRKEVEKAVARIQELERKGARVAPMYFVIDRDEELTGIQNSDAVKLLQWQRKTAENYLIDLDVLATLLRDESVTRNTIASAGEVGRLCRTLAFSQLDALAAREVYNSYGYKNSSIRGEDVKGTAEEIGEALFDRMSQARDTLPAISKEDWLARFKDQVAEKKAELELLWESQWKDVCDGKKFISDFHKAIHPKISEASLVEKITRKMRDTASENWRLVKSLLEDLFKPDSK